MADPIASPITKPTRDKYFTRWSSLKNERASWMAHWKEISTHVLPRSGRFFVEDRNRGEKRHNNIYDSTGTRALRVLAAGMMGGLTSPARPWFRLAASSPDLADSQPVKIWLSQATDLMLDIFQRSNTYRALHSSYEELGGFGTSAAIILPDFDNVIRLYPLTTGEYCIATDHRGQVDTLYREFQMTVSQLVKDFGIEQCSNNVQNAHRNGNLDMWVTVIHAIEPRIDRDPSKLDSKNMAWTSVYYEEGAEDGKYLRESGFKKFPAICPRWATSGGDIYGNSPGMEALGDIKQLQHEQLRKAQGIDYKTKPPLQVPTSFKNHEADMLPGGISYVDANSPQGGIRSAFEVNLDLSHLLDDIRDVRTRIQSSFYADLFLMLQSTADNSRMTATEVTELHEEKMLMLGPVLERLQNELLDPLVDITFTAMMDAGILPPPPPELHGANINVEFVSMLAQAQKAIGTNAIDRFVNTLFSVANGKPEVLDKFDSDQWADRYSDMLGVDPSLIVSDDQVQAIRQRRAQAQQAAAQQAAIAQGAQTAHTLSQTQTSQPSALSNVMDAFSGYNS